MKIAVSVESTNDLTNELLVKYDIRVIPFSIILNGTEYKDGDITTGQLFDFVDKNGVLPKTTALNEFEYSEWFSSLLKDYDAVIHIALSSGITSSCSHAESAAEKMENVYVVDSLSLTTGSGLLAIYARELANEGKEPKVIKDLLDKRKLNLQVSFVIERLDFLFKGGRCNSLQLLGANVFKIRPKIIVKDGKMIMDKKYRGTMQNVIENYGRDIISSCNPNLDKVFITYTTATEDMLSKAKEIVNNMGFKNVYEAKAGATVASHCGANTLGIIFFNDGE
ncbi:MAG: DegV family protein [Firmicutes bacterium]|nr:DegV family protein [Candidatus Caballimonas caccae]